MQLSVVILNYNVEYFLQLCLSSVIEAVKDIDAEIIVVDNNSDDGSCQMVKAKFPNVSLIENTENYGFSKGNNIGVNEAKGDYICILNPDTVVSEDTFKKVLEFATSNEDLGVVGCQLIDGTGKFLPESKRRVPTPKVAFHKLIGKSQNYYTNTLKPDGVGKTDVLVGAFMLLRRDVYTKVGGFDEDYFMYGEDIDLSYKILKSGYSNYYFGKTTVLHFKGESTLKDKIYAQRFYGAMEIFYDKHFKRNSIITALVKLGLKLIARLPDNKGKGSIIQKTQSTIITNQHLENLQSKLPHPVTRVLDCETKIQNNLIVLDANHLNYKTIIEFMSTDHGSDNNSYRILPKNSTFIIGSDSAIHRGEIISF